MNINNCYTGTVIEQLEEGCAGDYTSTDCTQTPNAISYLDLPAGSSQTEINAALTASLLFKDQQIAEFSSTAIEAGDNIEVTGVGSEENPYIISSSGGASDLQSVLNTGTYAEFDEGDSYVDLFTPDFSGNREITFRISNEADNAEIGMNKNSSWISGAVGDMGALVNVNNGVLRIRRNQGLVITDIRIEQPTVTTYINFPAKTVAGNYKVVLEPQSSFIISNLPAGQLGDIAVVTDATTPTYLGALTGGGTTVTPVWHNGTIWVAR